MPIKDKAIRKANILQYRRTHKERVNELNRMRYYQHQDEINARRRELYLQNADYVRIYRQMKRKENPEMFREYDNRYRKLHPEMTRARSSRYRARKAGVPGIGITTQEEAQLFEEYAYRCAYCGSTSNLCLDHVVPLKRNGCHDIDNAVIACKSCNSSKRDMPLLIWMYKRLVANYG